MNCIFTTHQLAKELLNKPDGFITATNGEEEYVIKNMQRKCTHANIDDISAYWTLILGSKSFGNIKR